MKVNVQDIKILRERTQASYANCKEALLKSTSIEDAEKYLIEKGLRIVDSAPPDESQHGVIKSYVHPGDRICAAVEVGCETDFVAKTEEFQSFVKEMAMQVAGMKPLYIARSDVPFEEEVHEMSFRRERLEKEGYEGEELDTALSAEMEQWFTETCLLEQAYVRDGKKSVKDLLAALTSKMQENCKVRRFIRWEVGCDEEDKEQKNTALAQQPNLLEKLRFPTTIVLTTLLTLFLVFMGRC